MQLGTASIGIGLLPLIAARTGKGMTGDKTRMAGDSVPQALLNPFYLPPSGEFLEPGPMGLGIRTLIRNAQTGGRFSCVENVISPMQMGPAPHVHEKLDELMLVTEGTVSWMVGDDRYQVAAGGWIFRPHGIIHTFWNATGQPARAVDMFFHQNLEDYLETLFHEIFADMLRDHLTPSDPGIAGRIKVLNEKFGITMFPEKSQAIIDQYGLHG